ncbi:hypothetical protein B0H14DRAFT_2600078 [Mycena olivaceomarginata]|nr:hypothetical protein B0H14DRAFT_2600078 [Mycena olivaceomarginata]
MYEEVAFPKFFLVMSGSNGVVMKTHRLICKAISNYININPTAFTLGTLPTAANRSSPTLWLVANIPDPLAQVVVDAHMLSSTNITIYTLPYNMPVMSFLGVFAGFMLPNTVMSANTAWGLIGTAIKANNKIAQFVQTHHDTFGPQVSSREAWRAFLVLYGTAQLQEAFRCRICPSIDHPTLLCLLPNLPSWLGLTPTTIAALEYASCIAAAKAQQQMRLNMSAGKGGSNTHSGSRRRQGPRHKGPPGWEKETGR